MKSRTLLMLTAVLAVLIGGGIMMMRLNDQHPPYPTMGAYLIQDLPVNDIEQISIEGPGERVRLEKKPGQWVVADRSGYPADFSRITDFVRALRDAKTGRRFETSSDTRSGLCLLDPSTGDASPENKGIRVTLSNKDGKMLADLLLGSMRADPSGGHAGGRYVSLEGSSGVYLIDESLALAKPAPQDWLDKLLLDIPASKIRSIAFEKDGDDLYRFERNRSEDRFKPVIFPAGGDIDEQALKKLSDALASFRIEDVIPASELNAAEFTARLEYRLFDGRNLSIHPGKTGNGPSRSIVRVSVDTSHAVSGGRESGQKAVNVQMDEETAAETRDLQDIVSRWVFVLSEWRLESLVTDPGKLLADEKPPAP
jgi:hypothetical protein